MAATMYSLGSSCGHVGLGKLVEQGHVGSVSGPGPRPGPGPGPGLGVPVLKRGSAAASLPGPGKSSITATRKCTQVIATRGCSGELAENVAALARGLRSMPAGSERGDGVVEAATMGGKLLFPSDMSSRLGVVSAASRGSANESEDLKGLSRLGRGGGGGGGGRQAGFLGVVSSSAASSPPSPSPGRLHAVSDIYQAVEGERRPSELDLAAAGAAARGVEAARASADHSRSSEFQRRVVHDAATEIQSTGVFASTAASSGGKLETEMERVWESESMMRKGIVSDSNDTRPCENSRLVAPSPPHTSLQLALTALCSSEENLDSEKAAAAESPPRQAASPSTAARVTTTKAERGGGGGGGGGGGEGSVAEIAAQNSTSPPSGRGRTAAETVGRATAAAAGEGGGGGGGGGSIAEMHTEDRTCPPSAPSRATAETLDRVRGRGGGEGGRGGGSSIAEMPTEERTCRPPAPGLATAETLDRVRGRGGGEGGGGGGEGGGGGSPDDRLIKFCSQCGSPTIRIIPPGSDDSHFRDVCSVCSLVHYSSPKVVVGAVCMWEDKFLLCRRAIEPCLGRWGFPQGYLELGESTREGATREVAEEAGAEVEMGPLLAVYNLPNHVQFVYFSRMKTPHIKAGPESLEAKLFTWDEIPFQEMAFPTVTWALEYSRKVLHLKSFPPQQRTKVFVRSPAVDPTSSSSSSSPSSLYSSASYVEEC